jgi:hypothetical protein
MIADVDGLRELSARAAKGRRKNQKVKGKRAAKKP